MVETAMRDLAVKLQRLIDLAETVEGSPQDLGARQSLVGALNDLGHDMTLVILRIDGSKSPKVKKLVGERGGWLAGQAASGLTAAATAQDDGRVQSVARQVRTEADVVTTLLAVLRSEGHEPQPRRWKRVKGGQWHTTIWPGRPAPDLTDDKIPDPGDPPPERRGN
jgi:hypothetical protein